MDDRNTQSEFQDLAYGFDMSSFMQILGAILVLIVGIYIAKAVGRLVRKALEKTRIDSRGYFHDDTKLSHLIGSFVKYFLYFVTAMIVLDLLDFDSVLSPFVGFAQDIMGYLPNILAAIVLAVIAHILGTIAKNFVTRLLSTGRWSNRYLQLPRYAETFGNVAYALVLLLFAPSILAALNIEAISEPVGNVIDTIINYLPLFIGAIILLVIGHFIAKFVANLAASLANSINLQRWTGPKLDVAKIVKSLVYFLILFPIAVQALSMFRIEAIYRPAHDILEMIMAWIPRILVAAFLIYVGYLLAKIVKNLTVTLLSPLRIDDRVAKLIPMLKKKTTQPPLGASPLDLPNPAVMQGTYQSLPVTQWLANIIGILVFGFFLVEGTEILNLDFISDTVVALMAWLPRIILAAIIVLAGIVLANIAAGMMNSSNPFKNFIQPIIITLAVVIALTEVGLASIIITSGFLIVMIAIGAAFIISVGIGSIPAVKRFWDKKQNIPL